MDDQADQLSINQALINVDNPKNNPRWNTSTGALSIIVVFEIYTHHVIILEVLIG